MPQSHFDFYYATDAQPIVIGFCGAKFHGKDTAASVLVDHFGFNAVAMADGLRKTVATALRVNEGYFTDPEKKEEIDPRTGKSRRYWLQWIGTEGFRSLWDDVWVSWWYEEIKSRGYSRVVTTDVRFPNEVEWLRKFEKVLLIRIVNPRIPESGDGHASEALHATLDADLTLLNDGTKEELRAKVAKIIEERFGIEPILRMSENKLWGHI